MFWKKNININTENRKNIDIFNKIPLVSENKKNMTNSNNK